MSQENVEVARRSIDAFSQGDLDAVLETLSPEVELASLGSLHGFAARLSRAPGLDWVLGRLLEPHGKTSRSASSGCEAVDDRVLTLGKISGKGRESGVAVEAEAAWVHTDRGRHDRPRSAIRHLGRSPRSRRAFGVGDVAGERGGRRTRPSRRCNRRDISPDVGRSATRRSSPVSVQRRRSRATLPIAATTGVRQWWANLNATFHEFEASIDQIRDEGDVVVALGVASTSGSRAACRPGHGNRLGVSRSTTASPSGVAPTKAMRDALEAAGLRE